MALPILVAAGTYTDGVSSTTPGLPAGWQENDIFLLYTETDAGSGVGAGGYAFAADAEAAVSTRLSTFWRRAGASEVTHAVGNGIFLNGAVTTVANCLVVGGIAVGRDVAGPTLSGWANTALANVTERFDDGTALGDGGGLGVVTGEKASAGEFLETTLTSSVANEDWIGLQIALAPSGGSLPTFVAAGTPSEALGGVDATPGLPAGWQENDIFLLDVEANATVTVSGYTELPGSPFDRGSLRYRRYWRRATASESGPTVVGAGTNHKYAVVCGFRGVIATGVPWNVLSNVSSGITTVLNHISAVVLAFRGCPVVGEPWNVITPDSSGTGTSITISGTNGAPSSGPTTMDDCLVVAASSHSNDTAGATFSGWTNADLANVTERFDDGTIVGNGGGIGIATGEKATAGAFGATTVTNSTVNPGWAAFHIALGPQPGFVPQVYRFDMP